jgi:hypothetical protein
MTKTLHPDLASGRWQSFPLMLQLAHVGSEVSRACSAKNRGDTERLNGALARMLELMDLTIADPKNRTRLRELCRAREVLCDYLVGDNAYNSTDISLNRYFMQFTVAAKSAI